MLTLELYIFPGCLCKESALTVAKKAVEKVSGVKLILRSESADQERAKLLGIVISPTFVLEDEICAVGEPSLKDLVQKLTDCMTRKEVPQDSGSSKFLT